MRLLARHGVCGAAGGPGVCAVRVQLLAARLAISGTRGAGVSGRGLRREARADSETRSVTDDHTGLLKKKQAGVCVCAGAGEGAVRALRAQVYTLAMRLHAHTREFTAPGGGPVT